MKTWFLDTNACIDYLRGSSDSLRARLLACAPHAIKIASIVEAELRLGAQKCKDKDRAASAVAAFLAPYEIVAFCTRGAHRYAEIRAELERKGQRIGANDMVLAATVVAHEGRLVTNNTRELGRVVGLQCEDWIEDDPPARGRRRGAAK